MDGKTPDNPGVIALPPLIFGAALIAGLLLDRAFPAPFLPAPWTRPVGVPLIAAALANAA